MKIILSLLLSICLVGCAEKAPETPDIQSSIEQANGFCIQDESDNIIYINLSNCDVPTSLLKKICTLGDLKYLHLEESSLKNEDLKYIGQIASLEVLNINQTKTSDEGLFHLLDLANLKKLNMSHYIYTRAVSEKSVNVTIDDVLNGNAPEWEEPDLGEGILALIKKTPTLTIEYRGGYPLD